MDHVVHDPAALVLGLINRERVSVRVLQLRFEAVTNMLGANRTLLFQELRPVRFAPPFLKSLLLILLKAGGTPIDPALGEKVEELDLVSAFLVVGDGYDGCPVTLKRSLIQEAEGCLPVLNRMLTQHCADVCIEVARVDLDLALWLLFLLVGWRQPS